jgi:hypothetical protein
MLLEELGRRASWSDDDDSDLEDPDPDFEPNRQGSPHPPSSTDTDPTTITSSTLSSIPAPDWVDLPASGISHGGRGRMRAEEVRAAHDAGISLSPAELPVEVPFDLAPQYVLPVVLAMPNMPSMAHKWTQEGAKVLFNGSVVGGRGRTCYLSPNTIQYRESLVLLKAQIASGKFVKVPEGETPLVIHPWFSVDKPGSSDHWRIVIDCDRTNRCTKAPKLNLPPIHRLLKDLQPEFVWGLKYDVKNGFDHVRRHPEFVKYFAIEVEGECYYSQTILMGESTAPWMFQTWLDSVYKAFVRSWKSEIRVVKKQHIDDMLMLFTSAEDALVFDQAWVKWCHDYGIRLNFKKSIRVPVQKVVHIGFMVDLVKRSATLTKTRQIQVLAVLDSVARCYHTSILTLQKLVGFMNWARGGSPLVLGLLDPWIRSINDEGDVHRVDHTYIPQLRAFFITNLPHE